MGCSRAALTSGVLQSVSGRAYTLQVTSLRFESIIIIATWLKEPRCQAHTASLRRGGMMKAATPGLNIYICSPHRILQLLLRRVLRVNGVCLILLRPRRTWSVLLPLQFSLSNNIPKNKNNWKEQFSLIHLSSFRKLVVGHLGWNTLDFCLLHGKKSGNGSSSGIQVRHLNVCASDLSEF